MNQPKIKRLKVSENFLENSIDIEIVNDDPSEWNVPVINNIIEKEEYFECYFEDNLITKVNKTFVIAVVY